MPTTESVDFDLLDEYYMVSNLRPGAGEDYKFVTEDEAELFLATKRAEDPDPTFWANFQVINA